VNRSRQSWSGGWSGLLLALLGCGLVGCATASPSPGAQRVIPVNGVPGPLCQNLGTVIGESEATSWGSGDTTPDLLAQQATADAMERAARRGATHIFLSPVTLRQKDGKTSEATLTGAAFRCPQG
jgi:hypothetical protein